MKFLKFSSLILILFLFILSGCNNDNDKIEPQYLVSFEEHHPVVAFDIATTKAILTQSNMGEIANMLTYNFKVFKLTYKTAFEGDTIDASGIIAVPIPLKKSETFPVISYQHPTLVKKSTAPSKNIDTELMTYLASTGMVVLIPDYIGFGESETEFHPYLHKQYTTNAVLDFIRASKEFIANEDPCNTNEKLFLFGYSQGGGATLAALSAIENNAANSDITVTATSCGSGLYNIDEMRKWMIKQTRYEDPYLLAYMLESFTNYSGLDVDYSLVYSPEIGPKISGIIDGVSSVSEINATIGTTHVGEMLNDDFEVDSIYNNKEVYASMRNAFNENSIPAWPIKSVLALYHGSKDETIPSDQSIKIYQDFQKTYSAGTKVKFKQQDDKNHLDAFAPTLVETIKWFKTLATE